MTEKNPIIKPRYKVVYQAWSQEDRPQVVLTPIGQIVADDVFGEMVKNRIVNSDCGCAGKKAKK